jgi:hypothetical protein
MKPKKRTFSICLGLTIFTLISLNSLSLATAVKPDQPHMQTALDALQVAQTELAAATPNKAGHRAKALEYVKGAIAEVKLGINAAGGNAGLFRDAPGTTTSAAVGDQPHMEAALKSLVTARTELMNAEHNKGGHRAKALELVNKAIQETNLGMQEAR